MTRWATAFSYTDGLDFDPPEPSPTPEIKEAHRRLRQSRELERKLVGHFERESRRASH